MLIEKNSLLLAPMAGVTDYTYRGLCCEMGAQGTTTEMVSAKGYLLTPKERQDVLQLRQTHAGERCALQIFGSEADYMGRAAEKLADARYYALDVNMGCPAPKIVSGGDGSAMLRDLPNVRRVIEAVVKASPLPVTVKMRLGWDEKSICYKEAGKMLEDCGVSAVTLHARTRMQMYAGRADREAIGELSAQLSVPVIGNGDINSVEDGLEMLRETGCHAVMIGRGAMGNPWIFRDWANARKGITQPPPSPRERIDLALEHARRLIEHKGDYIGIREMRKHMAWYLHGLHGSAQTRVRLNTVETLEEMRNILGEYLRRLEEYE